MIWGWLFSVNLLANAVWGVPPYSMDGSGRPVRLYAGTYVGANKHVQWEIEVIENRVYATQIDSADRGCMIAKPQDNGLFFVPGYPDNYTTKYGGKAFGIDNMPVLSLEPGGLVVHTEYEGGDPPTTEHVKRISSHPNHADMYDIWNGSKISCLPAGSDQK